MTQFIRRFVLAVFAALVVLVGFGSNAEARTIANRRGHRPRYEPLVVHNGERGDLGRSLEIELTPLTRHGLRPVRSHRRVVKIDLAGGGMYSGNRLYYGYSYGVEISDRNSGETLVAEAIGVVRSMPVKQFLLPGSPDPRIAQIAALQARIEALQAQVVELTTQDAGKATQIVALLEQIDRDNMQNALLMQQVALLQGTIADQAEQNTALTTQIASLVELLNQGSTANAILNQQIAALQAQQSSLASSNSALTSQMTTLVNLLAQSGTANAGFGEQLAALQAQQAALAASNTALTAQIAQQSAQITALLAQLAAGQPMSSPTVTTNSAFVSPTYAVGASGVRTASYMVTVPAGQTVSLSSVTLHLNSHNGLNMQNKVLKVGGVSFGNAVATVGSGAGDYTFTATNPFTSSAGSFAIDTYEDILATSTVGTYSNLTTLTGWSMTSNGTAVNFPGNVTGQSIVVMVGPTLVMSDWSNLLGGWVLPGTTGNRLSSARVRGDSNEAVAVSDVVWRDPSLGAASTFDSYYLYNGGTQVAGPSVMNTTDHSVTFALTNYVIASNTIWDPVLVGTAASYASGSFRSGSMYQFALSPSGITARGVTSGIAATVTGQLTQKYYVISGKTTFAVSSNIVSSTVRTPTAMDRPFAVWLTAGSTGWADTSYLKFKLSGTTVPSSINAFTGDVIDAATGTNLSGTGSATASWDSAKNGWILEFRFSSSYRVPAGTNKALLLQINSSGFANGAGSDTLTLELIDQSWGDGDAGFSVLSNSTPWTTTAAYQ